MTNRSVRTVLYDALYRDLAPEVSNVRLRLSAKSDCHVSELRSAYARSLWNSFLKKFQDDSLEDAKQVALAKFYEANSDCRYWRLNPQNDWDELLVGEFRDRLYRFFTDQVSSRLSRRYNLQDWSCIFDWSRIAQFGDNGPGSSLGGSGLTWIDKFSASTLTASDSSLFDLFDYHILKDPTWWCIDKIRSTDFGREVRDASKLSFVPKSHTEDRIICIEPSINMFFQKGVQALLEDRLHAKYGIDLAIQPDVNRYMAYIGSLTGAYCTIDLSSASDRISMRMLEWALPKNILAYFKRLRSRKALLPEGYTVDLAMISSMGNAYTFPLQTAIFAAAIEAVYRLHGIDFQRSKCEGKKDRQGNVIVEPGTFSVFGDDIVCVPEAYDSLTRLLELLGFRVNDSKSFATGDFRESCGHDYFCGTNIRGVYCKTLRTPQDVYSLINRLNRWSAQSGILLTNTIPTILKITGAQRIYVPPSESDDAGIHVPLRDELKGVVKLWDDGLQCFTYKYSYWKFVPTGLKVEIVRVRKGASKAERRREHEPNPRWGYSGMATLYSLLKGELRGGGLTPRGRGVYTLKTASLSHDWDLDGEGSPLTERDLGRWMRSCEANLRG